MVRAPTEKEYGQWKVALESQTADNTRATYVRPVVHSPQHPSMVCYSCYYELTKGKRVRTSAGCKHLLHKFNHLGLIYSTCSVSCS